MFGNIFWNLIVWLEISLNLARAIGDLADTDNCTARNEQQAHAVGRRCRQKCTGGADICTGGAICLCDHECGLSCVKLNKRCKAQLIFPNVASVRLWRSSDDTSPPLDEAIYDDLAFFECLSGYTLKNIHVKYQCDSTGQWTTNPECIKAENCPARNFEAASVVGRRCRKSCIPGGNDCRSNRVCLCAHECGYSCINLDNLCEAPQPIENMESMQVLRKNLIGEYRVVLQPPYRFNDIVEYTCAVGFRNEKPSVQSYCHGRRGWTKASECRRSCRRFNDKEVMSSRMICGIACQTSKNCAENMKCLCDGPCGRTCVNPEVECGEAPSSDYTTIEYVGEGFNKVAYYSCNDGFYVLSGSATRKCSGGGTWDGQTLSCGRVTCGDPTPAIRYQFGEVINYESGPYYVGHTFRFRCSVGFRLLGSSERTCLSNGRWSGTNTVCDEIDTDVRCPHPGVPVNGRLLTRRNSFGIGSFVEFSCNDGFVLVGERHQECLYFLRWSGNGAPLCLNPHYRDSASNVFEKLQFTTNSITSRSSLNAGRFISASFGPGHEIYFVFDLSRSVHDSELNNSLEFAIKLIERLSANATGEIEYGIIVFASDYISILDIHDKQPSANEVIQLLQNIGRNRTNIQEQILSGTFTSRALQELSRQLAFSYVQDYKKSRKRHVFFLTDGHHNEGSSPEIIVKRLGRQYFQNPPEFYSITSCVECSAGGDAVEAYEELLGLANNKLENFILIPNFYLVQEVLDLVTDAQADFRPCGRAGDVGSVKQQANAGRVVSGTVAAERAWPWQVAISLYHPRVLETLSFAFRGGGSLINNEWVLSAAHLFSDALQEVPNWESMVFLTFDKCDDKMPIMFVTKGLHKRPLARAEPLIPVAKAFRAKRVIVHENFKPYTLDFDVALIKIGQQHVQNGSFWSPINSFGFINFTSFIRPVCLPCIEGNCVGRYLTSIGNLAGTENETEKCRIETNFLLEEEKRNKNFLSVITGFGHTTARRNNERTAPNEYLQQGLIRVEGDERCEEAVTSDIPWGFRTPLKYTDQMLCGTSGIVGENVDACQGDSGGPLVREVLFNPNDSEGCWVQIGIVSWGWGCGQSVARDGVSRQLPGFYTNLPSVMPWIKSHVVLTQFD